MPKTFNYCVGAGALAKSDRKGQRSRKCTTCAEIGSINLPIVPPSLWEWARQDPLFLHLLHCFSFFLILSFLFEKGSYPWSEYPEHTSLLSGWDIWRTFLLYVPWTPHCLRAPISLERTLRLFFLSFNTTRRHFSTRGTAEQPASFLNLKLRRAIKPWGGNAPLLILILESLSGGRGA